MGKDGRGETGDRIAVMSGKKPWRFMRELLEEGIQEFRPGLALVGMACRDHAAIGYFIDLARLDYAHVWQVKANPVDRIIYSDSWREIMLVPIDGCRFPVDVILTKESEMLREMGFYIPENRDVTPLRLEDAEWRYLWAVKESLKDHQEAAFRIASETRSLELGIEVSQAYLQAMADLQIALGGY